MQDTFSAEIPVSTTILTQHTIGTQVLGVDVVSDVLLGHEHVQSNVAQIQAQSSLTGTAAHTNLTLLNTVTKPYRVKNRELSIVGAFYLLEMGDILTCNIAVFLILLGSLGKRENH